ncbi:MULTISPECIES: transcriptional regulator [unclassified Chryseobacterium]|uniref:LexA family transcriptional regulator n=1 Tax=unclassified Chryseobacterium TaxID=2593645 RepID=UPI00226A95CA|nr:MULTISPECIES: transcriptional regulator [unclassified Chryseobacterium]
MNGINFRIKQLVDYFANGNNSVFANMIGVNEANIRSYINGTEPKFNVIEKICSALAINFEWLILDKGEMLSENRTEQITLQSDFYHRVPQVITVDAHNKDNIALVPNKLKAGYLQGYNDPNFIKTLPTFRLPNLNNGVFRMFEIEGNSMFPTLPDRTHVIAQFVDDWIHGIKDNMLYAIISNEVEDGLIKRCLNRIKKYDNLICKSDNRRNFPTQNISPSTIKEVWEVKLHLNFNLPDPADFYDRLNDLEAEVQHLKLRKNYK